MGDVKNQIINLLKTKDYSQQKRLKTVYRIEKKPSKLNIQRQSEKGNGIKNIRNLFRLKKENEAIKDRIISDIKTLLKARKRLLKTVRVGNFWKNNYIEYENGGDENKSLSVKEYLNKIKSYLRDIPIDLQKPQTWKTQLTIVIKFISFKDVHEEHVTHLKSISIEFMLHDDADEVIDEHFEILLSIDWAKTQKRNNKSIK